MGDMRFRSGCSAFAGAMALLLGLGLGLHPTSARACGNATWRTLNEATREVARAEEELESGRADRAWIRLRDVAIDDGSEEAWRRRRDEDELLDDGPSAPPHKPRRAPSRETRMQVDKLHERLVRVRVVAGMRARNIVTEALETLRAFLGDPRHRDDPWLKARFAEALGRKKRWPEALKLLADLEQRDLMPDPEAHATLAAAREATGDAAGAAASRARCGKVAKRPEQCVFPPKDLSLAAQASTKQVSR